jgi:hypothetical protein
VPPCGLSSGLTCPQIRRFSALGRCNQGVIRALFAAHTALLRHRRRLGVDPQLVDALLHHALGLPELAHHILDGRIVSITRSGCPSWPTTS